MIVHRLALAAAVALLALTALGCGARDGGACQIAGDCAAGFFCCKNTSEPNARGVCRADGTAAGLCAVAVDAAFADAGDAGSDTGTDADVDAATDLDADGLDAAPDASEAPDATTTDAGGDAGTETDAATDDAASTDAG